MKNIIISLTALFGLCQSTMANEEVAKKIHKFNWDGIEVTWLEDNRFPTYDVIFYFADGALSDGYRKGTTDMAFNLLASGTNRFNRKEIADNLDFFGVSTKSSVVHEYSTYSVSGLTKDVIPTVKKVCHLFKDAIYPKKEVSTERNKSISARKNMANNPGALASKAFREISLTGSPFSSPVEGKIKTIKKIRSKHLRNKLQYFNERVKKKIYLTGPKSVLNIKNIVLGECGWNTKASFEREVSYKAPNRKPRIHLITVPKANQAQVLAGKFLGPGEFENFENLSVIGHYLGGGFTSVLMSELRVKRGLTYSAYAYAGGQKNYGRAVISTFTKVQSIEELVTVMIDVLKQKSEGKITQEDLEIVKQSLKGGYPFQFESSFSFLKELMFLDHVGHSYKRFFNYNKTVEKLTLEDITKGVTNIFPWNGLDIVVLGERSLLPKLKKLGKVKVHNYTKFL